MAKKYTIGEDFVHRGKVRKADCDIQFTVHVTEDIEGSLQDAVGTLQLFRGAEGKPFFTEEIQRKDKGRMTYKHVEPLSDAEQGEDISYQAVFHSKPDKSPATPVRKEIAIPARPKTQSGPRPDPQERFELILEKPIGPEFLSDDGAKFKFPIHLKGTRNLGGKKPRIYIDNKQHPIEPVTNHLGIVDDYPEIEFDMQTQKRAVRVQARLEINGKPLFSATHDVFIPAKQPETPKDEWKSRYDLTLTVVPTEVGEDQHRFKLTAHLTKVDYCTKGPRKGEQRPPEDVPQKPVIFKQDGLELIGPDNTRQTDKKGKATFTTEVITSEQFDKLIPFWAQAVLGFDKDDNAVLVPAEEQEAILPAAKKVPEPPAEVADLIIRCEGKVAQVIAVDKDNKPCAADLTILPHAADVTISQSGQPVTSQPIRMSAGVNAFSFAHSEKRLRVGFSAGRVTKTGTIY